MPTLRWRGLLAAALAALIAATGPAARADSVTLKNGAVYRGSVDRDNTLVSVYDGLRRVFFRDSKIQSSESDNAFRGLEHFALVQPLQVHGGVMPTYAVGVQASPWDEFGRRTFRYIGPKGSTPVRMTQAINELGPYMVRLRGVDGFWQGQLATSQVPRPVVLGLLAKVDPKDENERRRVASFLIQAEWYPEAIAELDRLARDFPGSRETVLNSRKVVEDLLSRQLLAEIQVRRKAGQPGEVLSRLRTFPTQGVPTDVLAEVRDALHKAEVQANDDMALADSLHALVEGLSPDTKKAWDAPLTEVLRDLSEAPDAVRTRLDAFQKAKADPGATPEARFALAMSGWVVGADAAVADLASAKALWKARETLGSYLRSRSEESRASLLSTLQAIELIDPASRSPRRLDLETLTKLAQLMPPPLADARDAPGQPKLYRVLDDTNTVPTDYAALLPPEYHPLRSYPAVVALHSGRGPLSAIEWWAAEATRRGYIVIAPEYNLPGKEPDYRYTPSEHAAVELALRDARRRFAIDGDRIYLGGQLLGANMAWDFGLGHPDAFAGVAVIGGLPARYVLRYKDHTQRLPFYIALGDLAPTATEVVFELAKGLIARTYDVIYVEYFRRGLEDLPEEAPRVFDWMDLRRRDPYPKAFEAVSARDCDDRFYGLVIRGFAEGRTMEPDAVDLLGKNLKPATLDEKISRASNLVNIRVNGIDKLDVWVGPKQVDFQKKVEVRVNGKRIFHGVPKPDFGPFLEDLRLRGDRQQVYWLKASVG